MSVIVDRTCPDCAGKSVRYVTRNTGLYIEYPKGHLEWPTGTQILECPDCLSEFVDFSTQKEWDELAKAKGIYE